MTISRRTAARWAGVTLLALAPLPWLGMGAATATPGNEDNVTICHRTNAVTNPYRVITVDPSSIDGQGNGDHYLNHIGPVFDPEAEYTPPFSGDEWGDIIPPLEDVHDGLNWTPEGIAIYENGCAVTTTSPSPSSSAPTNPPTTDVSTPPTTPPTTDETTEIETSDEGTPSEAESSDKADPGKPDKGDPTERESSGAALLPRTGPGLPIAGAVGVSLLLLGFGLVLLLGPGRLLPVYQRRH